MGEPLMLRYLSTNNAVTSFGFAIGLFFGCSNNGSCPESDAAGSRIILSNYDQSCTTAADCVFVAEAYACEPCTFECLEATINRSSLAQYQSDLRKLDKGGNDVLCNCGGLPEMPCCVGGICEIATCTNISDAASE
jgi:hypothetical protein